MKDYYLEQDERIPSPFIDQFEDVSNRPAGWMENPYTFKGQDFHSVEALRAAEEQHAQTHYVQHPTCDVA